MTEEVVNVTVRCDEMPSQFVDEFEVITEGYYEWLVMPVIDCDGGAPGFYDYDNAIFNYCKRLDASELYCFIMQHSPQFEVSDALE